jgi:hypothetical protein
MRKVFRWAVPVFAVAMMTGVAGLRADDSANPQTNASDRNFDTNQPNSVPGAGQKAEDGANRALNNVDQGVHKAIGGTKKGAHKAKKGAKKAADKTGAAMDNATDKAMEPAKEPASY